MHCRGAHCIAQNSTKNMVEPRIFISGRQIASDARPYVIAELSANHNGHIETALKIIEAAKQAGADAVKMQTYRPDTITLNCDTEDFRIHGGLWDGRTLYDLLAPKEFDNLLGKILLQDVDIGMPLNYTCIDLNKM